MGQYLRCDCCQKDIEDGMDVQAVQLGRLGQQAGKGVHICGICEKTKPKKVQMTIQQARKVLNGVYVQIARETAAAQGRPAAFSGKIPLHTGKPD